MHKGSILMVRWLVTRGDKAQALNDGLQDSEEQIITMLGSQSV